ncbi:MAG: B12-binding domain-containing radical SAM protein [Rhodothermia bacterium]|nr:MAG: B12-binding domain-containing radical SAM protein [Rhodothermia bacterium]
MGFRRWSDGRRHAMNALLIYPEFPDTFWSFKHALKFIRKKAAMPPLGLLTVAAMMPSEWNKRLVDTNIQSLEADDLIWADYAFISAMIVQQESTRRMIARCKDAGVTVVAGGPLFTLEHGLYSHVDHFVLNEAEITFPLFLADLRANRPKHVYSTSEFADTETTPAPLWDLVDWKQYASMSVQFSRGCPFDCDFCNVTALLGHRPRIKTAEQILTELDGLYDLGWRGSVFFVDDNLIGNKRYLKNTLLPALIEWRKNKKGFAFNTEASMNIADDADLLKLMVQAGFDSVFVGIETPSVEGLAECGKLQNVKRNLLADVKKLHRAGIQVQGGFIVGFDSDTTAIFQQQIDFIQQSSVVTAMVGMLQAIPGTQLYERMKNAGRLLMQSSGDNADGKTNLVPKMGLEQLNAGYKAIMSHIYAPSPYYERVRSFLREYNPPRIKAPIRKERLMAFVRSMYRLGVFGKERLHYWKLIVWTVAHRPRSLPLAVTLAIYGFHFRKVSELHVT